MALVDLFNQAMSANGVTANIASPEENSREAALCRQWYTFTRDLVMGAAPWPSLKAYARLARERTRADTLWAASDPAPEFLYSYAEPADMLRPRHMQSFGRFLWAGKLIHSNEEQPILFYLKRVEDIDKWDEDLRVAITYALAAQISIPVTGRSQRLQENMQIAQLRVDQVSVDAANADSLHYETIPDWLQIRGYANSVVTPYYYPLGSLNLGTP